MGSCYSGPGDKSKLHEAVSNLGGEIQPLQHAMFAMSQIEDRKLAGIVRPMSLLETQLHYNFRIGQSVNPVKDPPPGTQPTIIKG